MSEYGHEPGHDRLTSIRRSHEQSDCTCLPERCCATAYLLQLIDIKDEVLKDLFRQVTFERTQAAHLRERLKTEAS